MRVKMLNAPDTPTKVESSLLSLLSDANYPVKKGDEKYLCESETNWKSIQLDSDTNNVMSITGSVISYWAYCDGSKWI